jgi:5'-nucleotidase / UDP-sugar diphosphatase
VLLFVTLSAHAEEHRLTFLHVNDVYEISPQEGWGGLAELDTLLAIERAKNPEAIFTFGGDLISPSVISTYTFGAHMVSLMNDLRLDVAVVGNHELDRGPEIAAQRFAESRFPWLAANVAAADGNPLPGVVATTTLRRGDVDIGFVGLLTPSITITGGPRVTDPIAAAKSAIGDLRANGIDFVVALTHLDIADDLALVRAVPEIDLVLGGHDHDPVAMMEGATLVFKAGSDAHWLGVVEMRVDLEADTVVPSWRMVANHGTVPAPEVQARVDTYEQALDVTLRKPLGKTKVPLDTRKHLVRSEETAFGDYVADVLRARLRADVAFVNGGGIRGDRTYKGGHTLTSKDVVGELPFANKAVLLEVSGADLRASIERGLSGLPEREGRFLQVSGLAFTYDPDAPVGSRVRTITVAGEPLDPTKRYRLATNDYLAAGGDGFDALRHAKVIAGPEEGELVSTIVIESIVRARKIAPKVDGRIEVTR